MYNANLDMCTWTFAKTLARKKKIFRHFRKKTLAETANYVPKGLRKGNPFQGPFAQLSYVYTYNYHDYNIRYKSISYVKSCVQYLQWSACAALHTLKVKLARNMTSLKGLRTVSSLIPNTMFQRLC